MTTVKDKDIRPPHLGCVVMEAKAMLEPGKLLLHAPCLLRQPRGDGGPVLVLPGFGTGNASTALLRLYLTMMNHDVRGWKSGTNTGTPYKLVPEVIKHVLHVNKKTGRPVALVGWSWGGFLARETAREFPGKVRQVVTLGTPVQGAAKYTVFASIYKRWGFDLDRMEEGVARRNKKPLTTPVTAIYSKSDRVVAWKACIDPVNPGVEHVEVSASHLGMGFSPEVFMAVARALATRETTGGP
jgi:hypothetical protein